MISKSILQDIFDEQQCSTFVYDLDSFHEHLKKLMDCLPNRVSTYYATKSNPLSSILKAVLDNNLGIDVASLGELNQALKCGAEPQNILVTGPAKSKKNLKILLDKDVNFFVIESINQLKDLNDLAVESNRHPKVLLRVQLDWKESTKSVLGGNEITPFGLDKDQWKTIKIKDFKSVSIEGFHVFQWGNILDSNRLKSIWTMISNECFELAKDMDIDTKIIDFGGGWGIPYGDEEPLDKEDISLALQSILDLKQFQKIYIELGRYAIGEFGYYLSEVIDRKIVRGQEVLVLDGGMNHLIRPALTNQAFPSQLLRSSKQTNVNYQIHGPLCSSLDTVGKHNLPKDITIGDVLLFSQCGAYGFTESMPFFLCHDIAAEVVVSKSETHVLRPSVDASWWLR